MGISHPSIVNMKQNAIRRPSFASRDRQFRSKVLDLREGEKRAPRKTVRFLNQPRSRCFRDLVGFGLGLARGPAASGRLFPMLIKTEVDHD